MKTAGIITFIAGLLMTIYSGFDYIAKENIVETGSLEITTDYQHTDYWQPYIGIGTMVMGGAVLMLVRKKSLTK